MATDAAGWRHLPADGGGAARSARRATLAAGTGGDETAETRALDVNTHDRELNPIVELEHTS
jgi:hypothetical protein